MDDRWNERLSEYLDGDLDPATTAALESHLAECDDCRQALAGMRALVQAARRLPDRAPAHDLWPGVASRLEPPAGRVLPLRGLASRPITLTLRRALAVAAALVAFSAAGAWWWSRTVPPAPGADTSSGLAAGRPDATSSLVSEDARYEATVAELRSAFELRRAELDTSTVRVVEQNLAIIDRAMDDARQALAADPSDRYLNDHLRRQMRRKVDLLRLAAQAGRDSREDHRS